MHPEIIKRESKSKTPESPTFSDDTVVNIDVYLTPFRIACESKSSRIVKSAVESLQV